MDLWVTIILMGAVTYALRLSLIALLGRFEVPPLISRALRFVPPAVLSAIALPELLQPGGKLNLSLGNARLLAGLLAMLVARRTRNVLLTVAAGMAGMWVLQAFVK
jgi:branched-subunit amino acid transport protein